MYCSSISILLNSLKQYRHLSGQFKSNFRFFYEKNFTKEKGYHPYLLISVVEKSREILYSPVNVIINISLQCFHLTGYIIWVMRRMRNCLETRTKSIDQIPWSRSKTGKKNPIYKQTALIRLNYILHILLLIQDADNSIVMF